MTSCQQCWGLGSGQSCSSGLRVLLCMWPAGDKGGSSCPWNGGSERVFLIGMLVLSKQLFKELVCGGKKSGICTEFANIHAPSALRAFFLNNRDVWPL